MMLLISECRLTGRPHSRCWPGWRPKPPASLPGEMGPRWRGRGGPGEDRDPCRTLASESLVSLPLLPSIPSSPFAVWVFTCLARWSDLMNLLLQVGQANLFSPVCVLRCLCSSSDLVNLLPSGTGEPLLPCVRPEVPLQLV